MTGFRRWATGALRWWLMMAGCWASAVSLAQDVDSLTLKQRAAGRHIIVIADMETHRPLQHAAIKLNTGEQLEVGWTGRFEMKNGNFDSIQVMCPNYLTRHMTSQQLQQTDTVLLIPTGLMLSEVVVIGKAMKMTGFNLQELHDIAVFNAPPPATANFDFANLIDRRGRRDKKHLKRAKSILENY